MRRPTSRERRHTLYALEAYNKPLIPHSTQRPRLTHAVFYLPLRLKNQLGAGSTV
jgi:hypothetical protein